MANHELEGVRRPEHNLQNQEELSHETLVNRLRSMIEVQQNAYQGFRSNRDREVLPPATIIRSVLDRYSGTPGERGETSHMLRTALDALNFHRYEVGSHEEGLAGSLLQAYHGATGEESVKLTNPNEIKLFDAMAEAAGITRERGQADIPIPQNARYYNKYLMSDEYQQKFDQAQARKNK